MCAPFLKADVRSICDVGQSTKLRKQAAIGRKGIGFKSVFMLSDTPSLISGDFCFKFDVTKYGLFGYVVPEWQDRSLMCSQLPEMTLSQMRSEYNTCIWLPTTQPEPPEIQDTVDPVSLLFFRKLREVTVEEGGTRRRLSLHHMIMIDPPALHVRPRPHYMIDPPASRV